MGTHFTYNRHAERPVAVMWWREEDDQDLVDFSDAGYSFVFKVAPPGRNPVAVLTKSTGIVGSVGSGVEPTGTPNVVITWNVGDLDIEPGNYKWQCIATLGSDDRFAEGTIKILDAIL